MGCPRACATVARGPRERPPICRRGGGSAPRSRGWRTGLAAVAFFVVAASSAGAAARSLEISSRCIGKCEPRLVALTPDRLMALWTDNTGGMFAQGIDARAGALVGLRTSLGLIATDEEDQHLAALAMPDGDLVLVGALADGRVTFTRGSIVPDRRVAPRVVLPAAERTVLGLAATVTGTDVAALVLYGERVDMRQTAAPMDVTLLKLDGRGQLVGKPRLSMASSGFEARLAQCLDTLYMAWRSGPSVVFATLSGSGERSSTRSLRIPLLQDLGPILCVGGEARLFATAAIDRPFTVNPPTRKEIQVASIGPEGRALDDWRVMPVPGPIAYMLPGPGRLYLAIDRGSNDGFPVQALETSSEKLAPVPARFPLTERCLILDEKARTACASRKVIRMVRECKYIEDKLAVSLSGTTAATPAPGGGGDGMFFDGSSTIIGAGVPAPGAPALSSIVHCGDAAWAPLRAGLDAWCSAKKRKKSANSDLKEICRPDNPTSLLHQATNCTDLPLSCRKAKGNENVLQVEAAEIAAGAVQLKYMGCSVDLKRAGEEWSINSYRCED
jgi:hypothetical protein